jgi:hypothetical protein
MRYIQLFALTVLVLLMAVGQVKPLKSAEAQGVQTEIAAPQPEDAAEKLHAKGRAFLAHTDLELSDLDSVEAAAELAKLGSRSHNFLCGTVLELYTEMAEMEGTPFPRTSLKLWPYFASKGRASGAVTVVYWGGEAGGQYLYTSSTPDAQLGEEVCVFITHRGKTTWLSGENAYLKVSPEGLVGLGKVKAAPESMRSAIASYLAIPEE